jgi:hypothetical protein
MIKLINLLKETKLVDTHPNDLKSIYDLSIFIKKHKKGIVEKIFKEITRPENQLNLGGGQEDNETSWLKVKEGWLTHNLDNHQYNKDYVVLRDGEDNNLVFFLEEQSEDLIRRRFGLGVKPKPINYNGIGFYYLYL